ncbi:MAG: hypothetical protein ACR2QC_00025 [Gammaproteobacteria bacterium]
MSTDSTERNGTEISQTTEDAKGEVSAGDAARLISHETTEVSQTHWSGPVPSPEDFNKYPDSMQDRIMTLAEQESEHRRAMIKESIGGDIAYKRRGQVYSFIALLTVVLVSGSLVFAGHPYGLVALVGLMPLLGPFLEKLKELFSSDKKESQ